MSGPVAPEDSPAVDAVAPPSEPVLEVSDSRTSTVGGVTVHRALPRRDRRTIGAWCFLDHFGPLDAGMEVGPHPHIGLQTVTWLIEGDVVHHDSLGSEQRIRPGQLNLMTAGAGVAHAEETPATSTGRNHGVQLWVALPEATRHGAPAFEHHPELPRTAIGGAVVTVIAGGFGGERSPARTDTPLVGVELTLAAGEVTLELDPAFEHGVVVLDGAVAVDGAALVPGRLAFLGEGRTHLRVATRDGALALLIGGAPFETRPLMWWNFVARTREEVDAATREWNEASPRFGDAVVSGLRRIPAPPTPW